MKSRDLAELLKPYGLRIRGQLSVDKKELEALALAGLSDEPYTISLVGNIGSSFWTRFTQCAEFHDAAADPLDRWSRRIAEQVAGQLGAVALFPFDGPPYYPFQRWARRAEALSQSPLGLMIHPRYGLWHAYRFALLMAKKIEAEKIDGCVSPCLSCAEQPCLRTCPVDAFSEDGYAVDTCTAYLKHNPAANCHSSGCLARLACPVGTDYRYWPAQNAFHLKAFVATRRGEQAKNLYPGF